MTKLATLIKNRKRKIIYLMVFILFLFAMAVAVMKAVNTMSNSLGRGFEMLLADEMVKQKKEVDSIFSTSKFEKKRSIVRKIYEFSEISDTVLKEFPISIAVVDLNNDGIQDILAYFDGNPYYCSPIGCVFKVLLGTGKKNGYKEVLDTYSDKRDVDVLNKTVKGFSVISVTGPAECTWNGKKYIEQ